MDTGSIQHSKRKNLYWSFKEARKFVHKLNLKSQSEWSKYCSSGKKPIEVPSHPHVVYSKEWISMGNWLGTGTVAPQNQEFDFELLSEMALKDPSTGPNPRDISLDEMKQLYINSYEGIL